MLNTAYQLYSLLTGDNSNRALNEKFLTDKRRDVLIAALELFINQQSGGLPMSETTETLSVGVPVVLAIPHTRIRDMVVTAVESPVGDWFRGMDASRELRSWAKGYDKVWYAAVELYARSDFQVTVRVDNPVNDDKGDIITKTITLEDFQRALILMATAQEGAYAHHFSDFLANNEDALTADLFMQMAIYGEEVFS